MSNLRVVVIAGLMLSSTTGCNPAARMSAMMAGPVFIERHHPYSVRVETAGGRETQWWADSQVSSADFRAALAHSLERENVFSSVVREGAADYLLDVFFHVDQPPGSSVVTVKIISKWRLIKSSSREVAFENFLSTSHTASGFFVNTMRLANEGAARKSIAEGIYKLSVLDLRAENDSASDK